MSIVAEATARDEVLAGALMAAVCLGVAVPLVVRWVRRGPLDLPERLPPGGTAWPLVLALAWGLLVWVTVPAVYVAWRGPALRAAATQPATGPATQEAERGQPVPVPAPDELARPASPPDAGFDLLSLPPRDVAFLAAVPHLAALIAVVGLDLAIYGGTLGRLGFSRRQAFGGLAAGVKLSLAFVPLVFGAAVLTDWFYQAINYSHPREHDLLRVLGQSTEPMVGVALAAGATVVAPLSEELLFRGHAQTVLRRGLARLTGGAAAHRRRGFPLDAPVAGPDATPVNAAASVPPAWVTWGAIVLASAMFASVHEPWTWPPIFLLSVCLGWAYERTGNLWAPVAVHAAFNAVSTLIFLFSIPAN